MFVKHLHVGCKRGAVVALLASVVSFVASAQSPNQNVAATATSEGSIFNGSSISYGQWATIYTFSPSAEPMYNPTWVQRLTLMPEVHAGKHVTFRGMITLSQEFTLSDTTQRRNEIELSDTFLTAAWNGWKEKNTGISVRAEVRFGLPTSRLSQLQTRILAIGPAAVISKGFNVLGGLSFSYMARPTVRLHRFSTGQALQPTIASACPAVAQIECASQFLSTGVRNTMVDVFHGPMVHFAPHETVSIDTQFFWFHGWLYPLSPVEGSLASAQGLAVPDVNVRNLTAFNLSVSWQFSTPVGITLGAYTMSPQLGFDGARLFPLFNRNTTLYLDATLDIEALISKFTTQEKKS